MIGALIILVVTVAVGVLLWAWEHWRQPRHGATMHHHHGSQEAESKEDANAESAKAQVPEVCCGLHAFCEKTGKYNDVIVYYDDEELDRFSGRASDDYSDEETEEFRDVLLTMRTEDAPGWAVSLEKRGIEVPEGIKPELELILIENS